MGWVVNATPRLLCPPGKTRYPLYRRLGGPQGRSGQVQKIDFTGIRSPDVFKFTTLNIVKIVLLIKVL